MDSKGAYSLNAVLAATQGTLTGVTVTSDPTSTVGGYFPLKIQITPTNSFPTGGIISISSITIQSSSSNCASFISQSTSLNTFNCNYNSQTVQISALSFSGGLAQLTKSNTIILSISNVQYNSRMSNSNLTIALLDASQCIIEQGLFTNSWGPANPAQFIYLNFAFQSGVSNSVCSSSSFYLTVRPSISVTLSMLVTIEIIGGVTGSPLSSPQILGSQISGSFLQGTPGIAWGTSYNTTILINSCMLPPTEIPFYVKITTYYGGSISSTDIVHQQTTNYLSAQRCKDIFC